MAAEGDRSSPPGALTRPRTWTFNISGGPPFQLVLPDNPRLDYRGGREIWKMSGDENVADAVLDMLKSLGVRVTRYIEEETPEQAAERRQNLGLE